jgi:hemerythrin-like domain-containing protein
MTERPSTSPGQDGPFLPRRIRLQSLIRTLVEEHATMKSGISKAKEATERRDFEALSRILKGLDPLFRQHIVDEESTILRLLIGKLGVKGAEEEIRVFQQHRPIYQLMQKISEFASLSAANLQESQEELKELFERHAVAEERLVFPKAESLLVI